MVKAAAGAIAVRALKGRRRVVPGRESGGAGVGREDSVVPAGPRGWERREPIFVVFCGRMVRGSFRFCMDDLSCAGSGEWCLLEVESRVQWLMLMLSLRKLWPPRV